MCQSRNIFVMFLMLAAIILPACCRAAETTLIFGGIENISPFSFEENGIVKGFYPDILHETARRAGFQADIKLFPFKRLDAYLQKGKLDGTLSIYHKKEREEYLVYSASPSLISRTRVFVKKGKEFPLNSIADLFGKRIGIIAGWTIPNEEYEQARKEGKLTIEEVTHYEQNIRKLLAGRVDCLIISEQLAWYHANMLGLAEDIVPLDKVFAEVRTYMAICKKSSNIHDQRKFMEKFDAALSEILADGTYENLQNKHGIKTLK